MAAEALPERAMRSLYEPVYPGVYAPSDVMLTASQRARAAWLWSRRRAVVAGESAAALLGASGWIRRARPRLSTAIAVRRQIAVHADTLLDGEVTDVDGIAVTTPARTAFDMGRRLPRLRAVQRIDSLANATDVKAIEVEAVAARHAGARGIRYLLDVLPLVDGGAESPQETRTRLALIDAGFPAPRTQIPIFDSDGCLIARLEMGWDDWLVGIEYDGVQHWTDPRQRTRDIDRFAALEDCPWKIIRVGGDMLTSRLGTFLYRVGAALGAAGWRP